jgi:hypothetical protein
MKGLLGQVRGQKTKYNQEPQSKESTSVEHTNHTHQQLSFVC